jgi:cbb3-type cytochrome c oxidase subunit III
MSIGAPTAFDYYPNDQILSLPMNLKSVICPLVIVLLAGYVANSFQRSPLSPGKAKEAKRLFKQKCTKCHGQDGAGNSYGQIVGATNLTDPEWQQRIDDKRLVTSIKHGRGQMPAFAEKLTEEQITFLVSYVRTFGKQSGRPALKSVF